MRKLTQALGGVAGLALLGALAAGGPAIAQSLSKQTPWELAQTHMLNQQEAQAGAALTASNDAALQTQSANASAYSAAQAQYQQDLSRQQQQYQQDLARHGQQVDTYNRQLNDYRTRISNPPVVAAAPPPTVIQTAPAVIADAPDVIVTQGEVIESPPAVVATAPTVVVTPTLVPLSSFANPDFEIAGAPVQDRFGRMVGRFDHMTDADEGIDKALIDLGGNKRVAVPEGHFHFDTGRGMLVADLSYDEMRRLPGRL